MLTKEKLVNKDNLIKDKLHHYNKLVLWQNVLFVVGIFGIWIKYNFISVIALSIYTVTRWTISGHHICHGGYNDCNEKHLKKKFFGIGIIRKHIDWLDWFLVEAWSYEHNHLHHCFLNETKDPDLIINARNTQLKKSEFIKNNIFFIFFMLTWRWYYYASNIFHHYKNKNNSKKINLCLLPDAIFKYNITFIQTLLPYFFYRFLVIPYFWGFIFGNSYFYFSLCNLIASEILTNIYSFIIIVPNHAGKDLCRFVPEISTYTNTKNDIIYRSVLGSANYLCCNDFEKKWFFDPDIIDFLQGYLNYQIEHHMFPECSCLEYKLMAKDIKKICEDYDVDYIKENVFTRFYKLYRLFVFLDDDMIVIKCKNK